jgi:hypothetical protein
MVWDEKLGLVQDWQLFFTREPLDDARDLNNIIFKTLSPVTSFKGCCYATLCHQMLEPRYTDPDLLNINGGSTSNAPLIFSETHHFFPLNPNPEKIVSTRTFTA